MAASETYPAITLFQQRAGMTDRELLALIKQADELAARYRRKFIINLRKLRLLGASEALICQMRATRVCHDD